MFKNIRILTLPLFLVVSGCSIGFSSTKSFNMGEDINHDKQCKSLGEYDSCSVTRCFADKSLLEDIDGDENVVFDLYLISKDNKHETMNIFFNNEWINPEVSFDETKTTLTHNGYTLSLNSTEQEIKNEYLLIKKGENEIHPICYASYFKQKT